MGIEFDQMVTLDEIAKFDFVNCVHEVAYIIGLHRIKICQIC